MALVRPESVPSLATAAFFLALIGIVLGFTGSKRTNDVSLQLAQIELAGMAALQHRIDSQAARIVDLESMAPPVCACETAAAATE
jgi:hypothetical protein